MKTFKVIKKYDKQFDNAIRVSLGEKVKCIEESDPNGEWANWVLCQSPDNEGWIPRQIVDKNGDVGTLLEDYYAQEFDLEIDEVLVSGKIINGWIWGYKKSNTDVKAWAPLNCIEEI